MDGDEVPQVYIQFPTMERMPIKEMKGFKRVEVPKGGERTLRLSIPVQELQKWDSKQNKWRLYPGTYRILVGSSSEDIRLNAPITIDKSIK